MKVCSKFCALGAVLVLATAFASADVINLASSAATTFQSFTGSNAPAGVTPFTGGGAFPGPSQPGNGVTGPVVILNNVTPTWTAAQTGSSWVSFAQTGPNPTVVVAPNGNYWFEDTFTTLSGETYTGGINVMADDTVAVFLNGHLENMPTNPGNFTHCSNGVPTCMFPTPVTFNSADFIIGGVNTLEFQLIQGGLQQLGLDYVGSVTGSPNAPTPEPGSLILLGTGLLGSAGALLRRRRS